MVCCLPDTLPFPICRWTDRETNRQADGLADGRTNRQITVKYTDRQTDRHLHQSSTDRQAHRYIYTHVHTYKHIYSIRKVGAAFAGNAHKTPLKLFEGWYLPPKLCFLEQTSTHHLSLVDSTLSGCNDRLRYIKGSSARSTTWPFLANWSLQICNAINSFLTRPIFCIYYFPYYLHYAFNTETIITYYDCPERYLSLP